MKFCPECGVARIGEQKFCGECGFNFVTSASNTEVKETSAIPPNSNFVKKEKLEVDYAGRVYKRVRRFGWKAWTSIAMLIMFVHAVLISSVTLPTIVSLETAASVAITEYLLTMFLGVVLLFRVVLGGSQIRRDPNAGRRKRISKEI